MSTRPSGRLISTTSAHDPSPSAPISASLKTQATYPPSVRERARKYPTAVAPPGATHEKLEVARDTSSFSPQSLLMLTGRAISKPGCVVAEQSTLLQRSHASPLVAPPISRRSRGEGARIGGYLAQFPHQRGRRGCVGQFCQGVSGLL